MNLSIMPANTKKDSAVFYPGTIGSPGGAGIQTAVLLLGNP